MGRSDMGWDGYYSLKAVDQWISVINSNLAGSTRIGFKSTKVKFKGGVAEVVRTPTSTLIGLQMPESNLSIAATTIDFSQGSIVNSTEPSHLAIQGPGFFCVKERAGTITYYTRDGEFFIDANGCILNSSGLYLVYSNGAYAVFDYTNNVIASYNETNLAYTKQVQFLKYSRYGSTIFEKGTSDINTNFVSVGQATVVFQSLETSNTSISQSIPELSLAQKMFSALSKVIQVHQTDLDTVINLIR